MLACGHLHASHGAHCFLSVLLKPNADRPSLHKEPERNALRLHSTGWLGLHAGCLLRVGDCKVPLHKVLCWRGIAALLRMPHAAAAGRGHACAALVAEYRWTVLQWRRLLLGMHGASHNLLCASLLPWPPTVRRRPHGCGQHSALMCAAVRIAWSPRWLRRVRAGAGRTGPVLLAAAGWRDGVVHLAEQPALLRWLVGGREQPSHCAATRTWVRSRPGLGSHAAVVTGLQAALHSWPIRPMRLHHGLLHGIHCWRRPLLLLLVQAAVHPDVLLLAGGGVGRQCQCLC